MDQGGRSDENARNHPHSPRARGERCARAAARQKARPARRAASRPQGRLEKGRPHRRRRDCRVRRSRHSEPVQILSGHRRARAQKAARPAERQA